MGFSPFDFDVVTSPEEEEAVLARLREKAREPVDYPRPNPLPPGNGPGERSYNDR